jgi:hypothetical protein
MPLSPFDGCPPSARGAPSAFLLRLPGPAHKNSATDDPNRRTQNCNLQIHKSRRLGTSNIASCYSETAVKPGVPSKASCHPLRIQAPAFKRGRSESELASWHKARFGSFLVVGVLCSRVVAHTLKRRASAQIHERVTGTQSLCRGEGSGAEYAANFSGQVSEGPL